MPTAIHTSAATRRIRALAAATLAAATLAICAPPTIAQFSGAQTIDLNGGQLQDLHAADLDGDGDLDIIACRLSGLAIGWYENLGVGGFSPAKAFPNQPESAFRARTVDHDMDGDLDIVAALDYYTPQLGPDYQLALYENQGGGVFQHSYFGFINGPIEGLSLGDDEGDGDLDVYYAEWSDKIWIRTAVPGGFSGSTLAVQQPLGPRDLVASDLSGDGNADLIVASYPFDEVFWFENLGGGSYGPKQILNPQADGALSVDVADLDGDGDLDVLSASSLGFDKEVHWYENQGGGTFSSPHLITNIGLPGIDVRTLDVDLDGDVDVVVAEASGCSWYANDGQGGFGPRQIISDTSPSGSLAEPADLNGDGQTDILLGSSGSDGIAWFQNITPTPWTDLGFSLAGVNGDPELRGLGSLMTGSPGSLTLLSAAPTAPTLTAFSLVQTPTGFSCGTLLPVPVLATLTIATNVSGGWALQWLSWPVGLSGQSFFVQSAVLDATAPCGVALSNALRAEVP